MGLIKILENDGDVHVDDNHEVDDDEGDKVDDGHEGETTISIWKTLLVGMFRSNSNSKMAFSDTFT